MPKVYAVILNYNSGETLDACLNAVFRTQYNGDFHVVVVDNASTDGSLEEARERFQHAEFIRNSKNIGFAAGNNVGIRFALERGADYVILINSDAIIETTTIARLVRAGEKCAKPSVLCPIITEPSGKIWYAGATVNWHAMRIMHTTTTPHTTHTTTVIPTESATGCVVSIHKDVFKEIGLLNESYFLYYEDADFSYCARKKHFVVGVVPRARALHYEVSEAPHNRPLKVYWLVLSALLFFTAHASWYHKILYKIIIPLRILKGYYAPSDKKLAPHVRRAFKDFRNARKHYISHC